MASDNIWLRRLDLDEFDALLAEMEGRIVVCSLPKRPDDALRRFGTGEGNAGDQHIYEHDGCAPSRRRVNASHHRPIMADQRQW